MIFHSLRVSNFRSWTTPRELQFAPDRINIISGPNGAGKSSLLTALNAVLLEKHNAASQIVKTWQPWGTKLGPAAELEFTTSGTRYRITKKWLVAKSAELSRWEGSDYRPIAEASQADQDLDRLADAAALQILLTAQNSLPRIEAGASVITAVQQSLGAQSNTPTTAAILERIRTDYLAWFTPTTGKAKTNTSLSALESRYTELTGRQQQLLSEKATATTYLDKIHVRRGELAREHQSLSRLEKLQSLYTIKLELDQTMAALAQLDHNDSIPALEAQVAALRHAELVRLQDLMERHAALAQQIASVDLERKQLAAPTFQEIQQYRKWHSEMEALTARLEASLLHLTLEPQVPQTTELLEGEATSTPLTFTGSPRIVVEVPGFGRITASGPAGNVDQIRQDLSQRRAQFGMRTLAELEALFDTDNKLQAQRQQLESQRSLLLAAKPVTFYLNRIQQLIELGAETTPAASPLPGIALDAVEAKLKAAHDRFRPVADSRAALETRRSTQQLALSGREPELATLPPNFPALLEQHRTRASQLEQEIHSLDLQVARVLAQATPEAMQSLEEELTRMESQLERLRLDSAAAKLLFTLAEQAQQSALTQYTVPVAERVQALLANFTPNLPGGIDLSPKLQPTRYQPPQGSAAVPLTELSAGEHELLHLTVRLALAETIAAGAAQPLVLDDTLTATDQHRLERVLSHLETLVPSLQVLIFTCHPERYQSLLPRANHIAL